MNHNSTHPTAADLSRALARFEVEAQSGFVQTPRYRLKYFTWGTGEPVIFVHGLCDTTKSFCMVMEHLVDAGFSVTGYELANGRDGARLALYTHEAFTADLIALMDHRGLDRVHILGSSFGSTITLHALATYPERFHRAVLQGGFAWRPMLRIERWLSRIGRSWPWLMGEMPIRKLVMAKLELAQFVGCPREIFDFLIHCSGLTPVRAAACRALLLEKLDLRPLLPSISAPVLMIGGDRDGLVWPALEEEVRSRVPHCRRVELKPCGHYPQYTLPVPMAQEMLAFFGEMEPRSQQRFPLD